MSDQGKGNGHGDAASISQVGQTTMRNFQTHGQEIAQMCARLAQLIPAGAQVMFFLKSGKPQVVFSDGTPVGNQAELVCISRPTAIIQQEAVVQPMKMPK